MASNETHAEIVREMRGPYYKMGRSNASLDKQMMDYMSFIANRIEAAHEREITAKDDERLTIVAMYENVIVDKDAEISELRERIKVAEYALTELQTRLVSSVYDGTMNPYEALEITERAIAAISEKGGAK